MSNRFWLHQLARWLCVATGLVALFSSTYAQEYPAKPVRLIVSVPPGGSADALARTLAPEVSRLLGQTLIVENKPGAATNLANEYVARAPADGYTILLGGSFSHSVNPYLFAKLSYDPHKDFVSVIKLGASGTSLFVVPNTLPVSNLKEFIDYAKTRGEAINYASSGIGSPGHIAGAYFNRRAGLNMTHVPYKGAGEAVRDLIGGQVQLTITSPTSILGLVRQGRAKALATTTPGRNRLFADIPGSEESGLPDFDMDGWYGIFVPTGTPVAVVSKIYAAFKGAMEASDVVVKLELQGLSSEPAMSSEQFATFVRDNAKRWELIVKQSGAQIP